MGDRITSDEYNNFVKMFNVRVNHSITIWINRIIYLKLIKGENKC